MKVISGSGSAAGLIKGASAVTIGVFDGVHAGHQKVLASLLRAKEEGGAANSVLITFDRHPLSVTHPEMAPPLLTTLNEKISLIENMGVDYVLVENFSREYSETDYRRFIKDNLVERLSMTHLVIGYDLRLGRGRKGSPEMIKRESRLGSFDLTVVSPQKIGDDIVSSSRIRNYVLKRELEKAARSLTRDYFFDACVVRGNMLGKKIDFPTANLEVDSKEKLVPPRGVYAVIAEIGGKSHRGMMNVGSSPTVSGIGGKERVEVHLLDFSENIYGKKIRVRCRSFVREEKPFNGIEELKGQLKRDREKVKTILSG